ncbi:MAG TPA: NfeD family protein [Phycisphaerales bacterium]|nr:NfeD family protein [Phycisphaerales bacterium]HMP37307.1 NfeD family protein [Phycisphaerales bacterium]
MIESTPSGNAGDVIGSILAAGAPGLLLLGQGGGGHSWFILVGLFFFAAALLLFAMELFIPTGGILGILCIVAVVASIVSFFRHETVWGVAALMTYILLFPIAVFFGLRLWTHSPLARRMVLGGIQEETDDDGAMATSEQARRERLAALTSLIGAEGITTTPLRPVGFVMIDGRRIDALAEGDVIDARTPVVVVEIVDNQVKVRPR